MTCKDLLECLDVLESVVPSRGVGLVIVDSVASLVRKEFDVSGGRGVMERTAFLLKVSAKLKYISIGIRVYCFFIVSSHFVRSDRGPPMHCVNIA